MSMASSRALVLVAPLLVSLGCRGDDGGASATESSTTDASTSTSTSDGSTSTTGAASTSTTGSETTSTTGGGVCMADKPFAINIAGDPDTYETCGAPLSFFAKRKGGTITVEICADDTCGSCDPMVAYDLDLGSALVVPEETCLEMTHETVDVGGVCRTRGLVMWRVTPAGPPIFVVTGVTPEPPAALDPATLSVSMLPLRSCGCDAADSWCCMGSVDEHSLEFTVDGEAPVVVDPGFVNFENLSYAGAKYEVVVTEAHEAAACGFGLSTGWYMRRL